MLKSHEKFHSANGRRLVLVADDEFINREILRNLLEQNEYDVISANDGAEALTMIRDNREELSLVLLDLKMPVMGGMEVIHAMREDDDLSHIPIIVLTSDQGAEVESLGAGASDFIPKPYPQAGVILARVRKTIELSEDREIISSTERDHLTGLYNKEYFYSYAEQFDQHHKDMEMDAIVVDINHFHMLNERFGKEYGDGVLKNIGERLREMVQDTGGIVCRREADTFMVYCPHGKDYQAILDTASAGLAEVGQIHLRMGVYVNADKTLDIERRFDRAKMAADTVRGNFSRTIGLYDEELHKEELYAEQLVEDFQSAIEERQFKVFYQPKFDIRPEIPVLASAEALVRWEHPRYGLISPGVFIPLFEENGLIQTLDHYIWRTAAAQIKDWQERYDITVPVSVNVSRIDMYDPNFVDTMEAILLDYGLEPWEMLLEITESAYTEDSEQIIEVVEQLRKLGFQIEMDDFGTGYSSLNMISTLPIDALKLDMQFIRNAFNKQQDTRMLEVIIDIAEYLSVPVIAEGVETEEQLHALKAMGCDIVQGYYFSRPVPSEDYERFIVERKAQEAMLPEGYIVPAARLSEYKEMGVGHIAQALSSGFDSIYYIDTVNDHYVQFGAEGRQEDLQIERSGNNFFRDMERNAMRLVYPDDRERFVEGLQKESLLSVLESGKPLTMTYRLLLDGEPTYHTVKAAKAGTRDDHHIVLGISNIDEQMRQAEEGRLLSSRRGGDTYASIVKALSQDYFSIYYVDTETDRFIEYTANTIFDEMGIEKEGDDFFGLSRKNIQQIIHPDDAQMFLQIFTKENVMEALRDGRAFTLTYRLVLNEKPVYVHLKALPMEDPNDPHIVFGISNVDAQIRREQSYAEAIRAINRDTLTGVKSKHAYEETEQEYDQRIAEGVCEPFAVVVCDINGLKQVNDNFGHQAGDEYLKAACLTICHIFEHSPVFRIGGDEFVAILKGRDYQTREALMEQLDEHNRKNAGFVESRIAEGSEADSSIGSVMGARAVVAGGLSEYRSGTDENLAQVFERADAAMYRNKMSLKA